MCLNNVIIEYLWKVLESTARLEAVLVHVPVLEVLLEDKGAAGLDHVELVGAVHVQDRREVDGVPVKEELWRVSGQKLVAQLQDLLHGGGHHQPAQPGGRVPGGQGRLVVSDCACAVLT